MFGTVRRPVCCIASSTRRGPWNRRSTRVMLTTAAGTSGQTLSFVVPGAARWAALTAASAAAATAQQAATPAQCGWLGGGSPKPPEDEDLLARAQRYFDEAAASATGTLSGAAATAAGARPLQVATQFGSGGFCGFAVGYALRKAGGPATVVFGTGFALLQLGSTCGWLEVHWDKIEADIMDKLGATKDKTGAWNGGELFQNAVAWLTEDTGISAGGFGLALVAGFRAG